MSNLFKKLMAAIPVYLADASGGGGGSAGVVTVAGDVSGSPVVSIEVTDDLTHEIDLGAELVIGAQYKVEVHPAIIQNGAAASSFDDVIRGWVKQAATVGSQGDGQVISYNPSKPVLVRPVTGKARLSFMRCAQTAVPIRVYVWRIDQ